MTAVFPGWHPMVVHFPLALVVTAALFMVAARLLRQERYAATFAVVGTWNLCLGAAAAVCALATGLAAVVDLHIGLAAHQAISLHLKWAVFSSLLLVLLGVWRGAGSAQESRPSWAFLIVLLAATAALIMTGYRGGQNVYRYGIGVHGDYHGSSRAADGPIFLAVEFRIGRNEDAVRPWGRRTASVIALTDTFQSIALAPVP
jgi:uncharacterized membrane protein